MKQLFATTIALCLCSAAFAQNGDDAGQQSLWEFQVVGFAQSFPAYPSSADQNLTILPLPFPVYRGKFLRFGEDLENLARGKILDSERINFSVGVSASFPEDSNKLDRRQGMPDLDFLLEAGPELKILLAGTPDEDRELNLSLQLRAAATLDGLDTKGRGIIFNPELEYRVRNFMSPRNELRFRASSTWASDKYMDYFYGVAAEFATPDRPLFEANAGYLNTELLLGLNRKISERLEFRGSLRLWVNKGAENNTSPLFQRDYDTGIRLALYWTAWQSKPR
tara:strand:+ start:10181 stop:11020 length:840 start_codon:yes stop_codon:yes gene_type:complete